MNYPRADTPAIDLSDKVNQRTYYESLRGEQETERSSWMGHWGQLAAFFLPRSPRWNTADVNQGDRKDFAIINEAGGLALRTLGAGMLTGMSNPTSVWFKIGLQNHELDSRPDVRQWCEAVEDIIRRVFIKSNFYQTLLTFYKEQGLYGTSAFLIEQDREQDPRKNTFIRCKPYPIGSYTLSQDEQLRTDLSMRTMSMKVRDVITAFGYDNVSTSTQSMNDSSSGGTKETWRQIVHVIHKSSYFGSQAKRISRMPWISSQYELDSFDPRNAIITTKGYWENPLIVGRWDVTGENVYGESPAMDILGSTMSLQAYEDRMAQGAEKLINPPMIAGANIDPARLTTLPGEVTYAETEDVRKVFTTAYQIDFGKGAEVIANQIDRIVARINDGMYRSLFQMITDGVSRQTTAEEIRARTMEKMQILGPVIERNVEEALAPCITRTLGILYRFREHDGTPILPPMPPIMHNQPMKLGFESILAQAQRMRKGANITTFFGFVGNEVAIQQGVLDNVDLDEATRELGEIYDVPNKILRTPEQVAKIRAAKAQQQQQQMAADNALKLSQAGANLAAAPVQSGGTLLDKVMPQIAGGGQP